jgi:hypothetical protein
LAGRTHHQREKDAINKATEMALNNDVKRGELQIKEKNLELKDQETQAKITAMAEDLKLRLEDQKIRRETNSNARFISLVNKN